MQIKEAVEISNGLKIRQAVAQSKEEFIRSMTKEFIIPGTEMGLYERLRKFLLNHSQLNVIDLQTIKKEALEFTRTLEELTK